MSLRFISTLTAVLTLLSCSSKAPARAVQEERPAPATVKPGIEVLAERCFEGLQGKRVGLVTNPSGVDHLLRATIDILFEAPEVKLVALFAPEHGVRGDVYAGGKVEDYTDPATGLPVHSLYGSQREPTDAMLQGIDVMVYDIQDVGTRSYTFISTLGLVMRGPACRARLLLLRQPVCDPVCLRPDGRGVGAADQRRGPEQGAERRSSARKMPPERRPDGGMEPRHALYGYRSSLDPSVPEHSVAALCRLLSFRRNSRRAERLSQYRHRL